MYNFFLSGVVHFFHEHLEVTALFFPCILPMLQDKFEKRISGVGELEFLAWSLELSVELDF